MILTNIEHIEKYINYAQIGIEIDNVFSGLVIDQTNLVFINKNIRILDKNQKTDEFSSLLDEIIDLLEYLYIEYNKVNNKFIISDLEKFKDRYFKFFFNEDIIWNEFNFEDLEKELNIKFSEFNYYLDIIKKIDFNKYEEYKKKLK